MGLNHTYQYMQYKIADELGDRIDLLTPLADLSAVLTNGPIQDAIQSAIALWERKKFYFNELVVDGFNASTCDWATAVGQEYYGLTTSPVAWTTPDPTTVAGIDKMMIYVGGQRWPLETRTNQYMMDVSVNPSVTGWPADVAYVAQMFRFYPIPQGIYPIYMMGAKRLPALVAAGDSNAWTQDAYDLIRTQAKLILAEETLQDADMAAACRRAIYGEPDVPGRDGYLAALQDETTSRRAKGKIRPTFF